jgi:hypothetical protein
LLFGGRKHDDLVCSDVPDGGIGTVLKTKKNMRKAALAAWEE